MTSIVPFKTVRLDSLPKSIQDLRQRMIEKEVRWGMSNYGGYTADAVLRNTDATLKEVDLVALSPAELGLRVKHTTLDGTKHYDPKGYGKACKRGVTLGLELCPPETPIALLLSDDYKLSDEHLYFAMELVIDSVWHEARAFQLGAGGNISWQLDAFNPEKDSLYPFYGPQDYKFVFVQPRK